jgi:hypothetical protein
MNDPDGAQQWREMAEHLVEAHGAHSGGLIGYAPTWNNSVSRTPTRMLPWPVSTRCRRTVTLTPCRWMLGGVT